MAHSDLFADQPTIPAIRILHWIYPGLRERIGVLLPSKTLRQAMNLRGSTRTRSGMHGLGGLAATVVVR
jgi:hypothetical protein